MRNPQRHAELTDAGLRVLAGAGARGLTHRAVDAEARVPPGTTSNYFRSRGELLEALGSRIFDRLSPQPDVIDQLAVPEPSVDLVVAYVRDIVSRVLAEPSLSLALLELRLEAARHPALAATLNATLHRNFEADVAFHIECGLPGGRREVRLLHFAINGLILDLLTASIGLDDADLDGVIANLVTRIVNCATGS